MAHPSVQRMTGNPHAHGARGFTRLPMFYTVDRSQQKGAEQQHKHNQKKTLGNHELVRFWGFGGLKQCASAPTVHAEKKRLTGLHSGGLSLEIVQGRQAKGGGLLHPFPPGPCGMDSCWKARKQSVGSPQEKGQRFFWDRPQSKYLLVPRGHSFHSLGLFFCQSCGVGKHPAAPNPGV